MQAWDRSRALTAFETFKLSGSNAALAVYWLSLWQDDRPPARCDFNPAHVRDLLPAIALTEIRASNDAVCRLSGHIIDLAMGGPLRGVNMLALVGGKARALRSERLCAIVAGGVGLSRTRYTTPEQETKIAETLQLPFFGLQEDDSCQYLTHTNWRPRSGDVLTPHWNAEPDEYFAAALS